MEFSSRFIVVNQNVCFMRDRLKICSVWTPRILTLSSFTELSTYPHPFPPAYPREYSFRTNLTLTIEWFGTLWAVKEAFSASNGTMATETLTHNPLLLAGVEFSTEPWSVHLGANPLVLLQEYYSDKIRDHRRRK
jgi:hypothetical protein